MSIHIPLPEISILFSIPRFYLCIQSIVYVFIGMYIVFSFLEGSLFKANMVFVRRVISYVVHLMCAGWNLWVHLSSLLTVLPLLCSWNFETMSLEHPRFTLVNPSSASSSAWNLYLWFEHIVAWCALMTSEINCGLLIDSFGCIPSWIEIPIDFVNSFLLIFCADIWSILALEYLPTFPCVWPPGWSWEVAIPFWLAFMYIVYSYMAIFFFLKKRCNCIRVFPQITFLEPLCSSHIMWDEASGNGIFCVVFYMSIICYLAWWLSSNEAQLILISHNCKKFLLIGAGILLVNLLVIMFLLMQA